MISKIYLITNLVNNKKYVGKTLDSLEKRFKQHINEANKERSKHRPLYRAINKYGKENFVISLIEYTNLPEEREIYWIDFYNSYGSTGYNATKGGDGKSYINEELILFYLKEVTTNCNKIAKILEYTHHTVINVAKKNGLYVKTPTRNFNLSDDLILKIKELYVPGRKGFGRRKIAKLLNIKLTVVDTVIRSKNLCIISSAVEQPSV